MLIILYHPPKATSVKKPPFIIAGCSYNGKREIIVDNFVIGGIALWLERKILFTFYIIIRYKTVCFNGYSVCVIREESAFCLMITNFTPRRV